MEAITPSSRGGADEGDNGNQGRTNLRKESAKNRNRSPCAPCQNSKHKCEGGTPCPRCLGRGEPEFCLPGRKGRRNTFDQFIDESSRYSSEVPRGRPRRRVTGPTSRGTRKAAASIDTETELASPTSPQSQLYFWGTLCAEREDMDRMLADFPMDVGATSLDHCATSITRRGDLHPQNSKPDRPRASQERGLRRGTERIFGQRDQYVKVPSHTEIIPPHQNQTLDVPSGILRLAEFGADNGRAEQTTENTNEHVLDQSNLSDDDLRFLQQYFAQQTHQSGHVDTSMHDRDATQLAPNAMGSARATRRTIKEGSSELQLRSFNGANDPDPYNHSLRSQYASRGAYYGARGNDQEVVSGGMAASLIKYALPATIHTKGQVHPTELVSEQAQASFHMPVNAPAGFYLVDQAIPLTSPTSEHSDMRQPDATAPNDLDVIADWDKFCAELNSSELNSPW